MTAIWRRDGALWRPMAPTSFPDEATLHRLVEDAPQMLPVAGSPRLVILGREVQLGPGYVDLLAVEPTGRLTIIEIKLAKNSEARRAVVSQVLAYAASLHGMSAETLEKNILAQHLAQRQYKSLPDAMAQTDQEGAFDRDAFEDGLKHCLAEGRFRVVVVLDSAPAELIRLGTYLETITDRLAVDLITVSQYDVDGASLLVPQRVDAGKLDDASTSPRATQPSEGQLSEGAQEFKASIAQASAKDRPRLEELTEWAISLESAKLAVLSTFRGVSKRWTLLPRLPGVGSGLVTIWNENGPAIQLWRSVFEKRAPSILPQVERKISPTRVGQGNNIREFDAELMGLLTAAYREAAGPRPG